MGGFRDLLRSGGWLRRERMRLRALAVLIASLAGVVYLLVASDSLSDFKDRPLGTDFSNVYPAVSYVLDGVGGTVRYPQTEGARRLFSVRPRRRPLLAEVLIGLLCHQFWQSAAAGARSLR